MLRKLISPKENAQRGEKGRFIQVEFEIILSSRMVKNLCPLL